MPHLTETAGLVMSNTSLTVSSSSDGVLLVKTTTNGGTSAGTGGKGAYTTLIESNVYNLFTACTGAFIYRPLYGILNRYTVYIPNSQMIHAWGGALSAFHTRDAHTCDHLRTYGYMYISQNCKSLQMF